MGRLVLELQIPENIKAELLPTTVADPLSSEKELQIPKNRKAELQIPLSDASNYA
jgi:hypothetical protein